MDRNLWIEEEYFEVNDGDRRYSLGGDPEPYESRFTAPGEAYRALLKEHGRCVGRMYIDKGEDRKHIGWIFVKRMPYDDAPRKTYLQETWVTLHNGPPTRTVTYDLHYI